MIMAWLTLAVSIVGIILIPILIVLFRLTVVLTKDRDKIETIANDLSDLVDAKDKIHAEIYRQMREDRSDTNRRLRWLEENLWKGNFKQ